jgi:TetR/AcrR family acrAB operon transcriptional repressor
VNVYLPRKKEDKSPQEETMPRKTKEETEKTRLGILDTALDLIYEKGYSATNLHDIAERLGMTRGAVYWHFKNKQELFLSLIEEIEQELDALLTKRAKTVNTLDDLQAFFMYYAKLLLNDERTYKYLTVITLKIEWNEELEEVVALYGKQLNELEMFCCHVLKKAKKNKELRPDVNIEQTSKSLTAIFDGHIVYMVPPFGERSSALLGHSLMLFFSGLKN